MARGKKKTGPVSGPGALSQRTDLSPLAQATSPDGKRPFGERKAIEQQVAAVPDPRMEQTLQRGVFAPTDRPGEPATAGAPFGPGRTPALGNPVGDDHDAMLRAAYEMFPHPDLLRLLRG